MSFEQWNRVLGGITFIFVSTFAYGITHWRLGRKRPAFPGDVPFPPDFSACPGFPRGAEPSLTWFASRFKWWMWLACVLCGTVVLIDAIMRPR